MPKKSKKQTRKVKNQRKAATPNQIKEASQPSQPEKKVIHVHELTASEIATAEALDAGMHVFKITNSQGDETLYFAANSPEDARNELHVKFGPVPDDLVKIEQVDKLPDGEVFTNDVLAKRDAEKASQAVQDTQNPEPLTPDEVELNEGQNEGPGSTEPEPGTTSEMN